MSTNHVIPRNGKHRRFRRHIRSTYRSKVNARRRFFKMDSRAVSNIVTSIMMLGIIFTLLGMVLTVYVPIWAKSLEAQHMEEVANAFTDLKSTVDSQIAQGDEGTTMSTRVRLGTEGGPLLGLGQSTGSLQFQPESSMMSIYNSNDTFEKYGTGRGRLAFESHNIYYVDQRYIYENGAIILDQEGQTLMKVKPNFFINNVSGTNEFSTVMIGLQGDLDNVGGIKSQTVQTTLLSGNKNTLYWGESSRPGTGKNLTISINTSFPLVWNQYFDDLLKNQSGLNQSEYYIAAPSVIGDPIDNFWRIDVTIRDVNKFTTTISYVELIIT
ncbi:MAG: hypothetical protein JSV49_07140 [Thermoplasmata archaeon]|nr:MAG: hypothetical protein JSV49_07140 [Thermoplasmata archaeon]